TATIMLTDTTLSAGETTTVTFRFSETVNGFTRDDIELSDANGTLGDLTTNDNGRTWTATFTPTANVNDASNTIRVNLTGVTNAAGNAGTGTASSDNYSVDTRPADTTGPTATITLADNALTAGETTTVTITFSEPVKDFDTSDIVCTSGTLSPPTANAERTVWTATFTPTADVSARVNTIRVNLAGVSDDAGNAGTGSASSDNYTVNTQRPTSTITLTDTTLSAGETTTVTFRFSETVNGFTRDDIELSDANGTLGEPTSNDNGRTWTATFTPTANVNDASNTIGVNLTGVTNAAGNAGTGTASSDNYTVNTQRPTATITLTDTTLTAGETTTVTFRFSETVNGFTRDDVELSDANGTLGEPTTNDNGRTWTATFTPTANVNDASNTIRVNLTGVTNAAGNAGTGSASSDNYSVNTRPADTSGPTATITLADSALTAGETTTVSFRFSEPVNGFDTSDIVCTSGTLSPPTANAERTVWTATFTPTANVSAATNTIRVNLTGVSDDAGNAGTGSASSDNYSVNTRPADTSGPTATITLADSALTAGETTTVSFRFSEPVKDFDTSNIVLTDANGTLSPPTANAERTVWTATFTPTANVSAATNTIRVNLAGVSDDAGNAGTGSASSDNYTVNTQRPTATITLADTTLSAGEITTVTFRFSETVNGFTRDDVELSDANGTLGDPTTNDNGRTWTATFTPTANVNDASNTIRVNLTGVTNAAGNAGTGSASSDNYTVNTQRPTATITLADTTLTAGETTTVTFRFSETVNGFTRDDIELSDANGTLGEPTTNDNGRTWTATFTPTANVNDASNTIRVNLTGVMTNAAGNAGTGSASSDNYTVNTTGPTASITLADTTLSAGETTTVTFRFSEPVNGFTRNDVELSDANGTLGEPTTHDNGRTWTATFTPTANIENSSNTIRVSNAAGRAHSASYQIDTRAPVVASATVNASQLVLRYTEGNSLDATHIPSATAFTVRIDNVLTAVTAIVVNAQDKTVSLTLATPVANGQAVTVAYTDPTTGNDANAVQDAAGNDAATFSAMAVDNRTPAPQSPAPSA
ncbi:Ig-like domain-containing protein, partial [Verminephrobacter aporrectodeae]|uniref:Ig-like domain-containing protein n=2 Tax=Verminephrobacter aporrectodeae TaxID=1110389 RepID=UPI002243CFAC